MAMSLAKINPTEDTKFAMIHLMQATLIKKIPLPKVLKGEVFMAEIHIKIPARLKVGLSIGKHLIMIELKAEIAYMKKNRII